MLTITDLPLSVLNRALDLYGEERATAAAAAWRAVESAQSRLDGAFSCEGSTLTPLALALAEYMSLTGPFDDAVGEYAGENGYRVSFEED